MESKKQARIMHEVALEKEKEEERKRLIDETGVEIGGAWVQVEWLETKQIYELLVRKRHGEIKEEDKKTNHGTTTLTTDYTPTSGSFGGDVHTRQYRHRA